MGNELTQIGAPNGPEPGHGRNKGSRNRSTLAKKLIQAKLDLDVFPMDEDHKQSIRDIMTAFKFDPDQNEGEMFMLINQFIQGLKNDPKSKAGFDAIMDSAYGKPLQQIENIIQQEKKYDYSKLTAEQFADLESAMATVNKYLTICELPDIEVQGGE